MQIVVDVADMKLSKSKSDVIITYSLGSCLGLVAYDQVNCIGGILHSMLPVAKDKSEADTNPYKFVDTGVTYFFNKLFEAGAEKRNLVVKAAGCSNIINQGTVDMFNIGERNYLILRKILWKNDIFIASEEVGGNIPRTVQLEIMTGKVSIKNAGTERYL
ncbi:MAG: hypothetical protein A2044_03270 [Candidatus Firestonebacteria bacterium GWA2_43_8]|nr:MAG: hypothetical protein A2044_03270 [Candidatus Firestonebacteria bacterium GWA2_43_8]